MVVVFARCSGEQVIVTETTVPSSTATPTMIPATNTPRPTRTAVPTVEALSMPEIIVGDYWWNDAVFYQVFVRSFYDSDGDGIGDLNGVIEKLDYLNDGDPTTFDDLGVSGIWLMPITESPSYHGYDVVDHFTVEQDYGTNDDFHRLVEAAHQRGVRVIVDLVLNHTSAKHPWFLDASSDVNSPYRDYYVWLEQHPGYASPWGSAAWHRTTHGYYYGVFWQGMPDLNYTNPQVTVEMQEVIRFWLDEMRADGFRLDGIKHLIEDGRIQENTVATHKWLREYRALVKETDPEAVTVGEVWSATSEVVKYVGVEVDLAFEFDTAGSALESARLGNSRDILLAHKTVTDRYPLNQFATFLTNHDQNRTMSVLRNDVGKAKTAASLLLTGPGVPFVYYGEELGQVGAKPDENIRTPMQWSAESSAGFTSAARPWRPPQADYEDVNVATQSSDPDSLLNHYRKLIHLRNSSPTLQMGDWREVQVADQRIYAALRHRGEGTLLVLINMSDETIEDYSLSLADGPLRESDAIELLSGVAVSPPMLNSGGGFDAYVPLERLTAYSTYVLQLR